MTAQESIRLDLYNGLQELLGNDRATYLMTHLLPAEAPDLLTKTEFRSELRAALGELRAEVAAELAALEKRIDDRLEHKFDQVNKRLDRVLLTVVGSMSVILAAVISSGLWS
jgi:hypothetical protein